MAKKRNIVEAAMRNNNLVFFFMSVIVVFGFIALPKLKKNEFPDVTIRQGVVAVVYPGATAEEIEERVAKPVEQYLFTFGDVNKKKTYSYSKDGMLVVFVTLVNDAKDAKMTWLRIRQGLVLFRQTDLPQGVLATAPPDIRVHRITDQPVVVNKSVLSFLKDLVEAVVIVILVMLFLFPLRTALVSSTSVPVCVAATWAIMYLLGVELNTVTLAALIVVLGMIVDDSVVVIDGYTDLLNTGHSRWYSAAVSTRSLMTSMLIATCSVSFMFFPMLALLRGTNMGDFVKLFPWTIFIALLCSFLYAIWVIPFLSARIIKRANPGHRSRLEKIQARFFDTLQRGYKQLLDLCFRHKWGTILVAGLFVALGLFLFTRINVQMLPKAERDSFAVEIHLATGKFLGRDGGGGRLADEDPSARSSRPLRDGLHRHGVAAFPYHLRAHGRADGCVCTVHRAHELGKSHQGDDEGVPAQVRELFPVGADSVQTDGLSSG